MNDTVKLVGEYGILIVIAGVFLYMVLRNMKSHEKAVEGFTEAANEFTKVMANHINTSTKATEELTRAIEELRRELK